MFCPNCGAATVPDAKYCRACGTDVALVQQALTGQLPAKGSPAAEKDASARLHKAISTGMSGAGFLVIALCVLVFAPAGRLWWFWMLIPAFTMLGSAISDFVRYRSLTAAGTPRQLSSPAGDASSERMIGSPSFVDALPPPSVTEGTTRHLEQPVERQSDKA